MKAKIDLEKFICSLMKRFYKIHNIDPLTTKCWLDKVLEDQGLEYRDGEIVEIPQDSEDERRKKEIFDLISISGNGNQFEEIKDWLEYKPQGNTVLEAIMEEKSPAESLGISPEGYEEIVNECIYGEEKTVDDVKPKFKVGDFIANDYCFGKVIEITNDAYLLDTEQGIPFSYEHNAHIWTIADAKDGDVLVNGSNIFIFSHLSDTRAMGYCHINLDDGRFYDDKDKTECFGLIDAVFSPATKEQRDLLFQKMKEAGYTFDFDKKELRKVEQNLANSENIEKRIP